MRRQNSFSNRCGSGHGTGSGTAGSAARATVAPSSRRRPSASESACPRRWRETHCSRLQPRWLVVASPAVRSILGEAHVQWGLLSRSPGEGVAIDCILRRLREAAIGGWLADFEAARPGPAEKWIFRTWHCTNLPCTATSRCHQRLTRLFAAHLIRPCARVLRSV